MQQKTFLQKDGVTYYSTAKHLPSPLYHEQSENRAYNSNWLKNSQIHYTQEILLFNLLSIPT